MRSDGVDEAETVPRLRPTRWMLTASLEAVNFATPRVTPELPAAAIAYAGLEASVVTTSAPEATVIVPPVVLPKVSVIDTPEVTPVELYESLVLREMMYVLLPPLMLHFTASVTTVPLATVIVLSKLKVFAALVEYEVGTLLPEFKAVAPLKS